MVALSTIKVHTTEWYENFFHSDPILNAISIGLVGNKFQGTQSWDILCVGKCSADKSTNYTSILQEVAGQLYSKLPA